MSDEILFAVIALVDLVIMMACWKAGRRWLELFVTLNYIFAFMTVAKFTDLFGFSVTVASIFYAAIFLGTDIITEHFGKRAGFKLVWRTFFAVAMVMLAQQMALIVGHTEETALAAQAMDVLFSSGPRIAAAGLSVFLLVQRYDIWIYHWIHKKTKGKMLWLRNIVSTTTSQFLDSILFFFIAFYGVLPNDVLIEVMILAFIVKFIVALLDTPFIYLSYWVKGKKIEQAKNIPES